MGNIRIGLRYITPTPMHYDEPLFDAFFKRLLQRLDLHGSPAAAA
jgi:hypothetical protein